MNAEYMDTLFWLRGLRKEVEDMPENELVILYGLITARFLREWGPEKLREAIEEGIKCGT